MNREKHFSSRERQLDKPASGASAAKSKSKGKGKRNSGDCVPRKSMFFKEISAE